MTASRYNRLLLDMHIPDWDAALLSKYDPAHVARAQIAARAGSVMVYCQSHVGLCYWPTDVGRRHAAMKGRDWLGDSIGQLRDAKVEVYGYYSVIFNNDAYLNHPDWRITPTPPLPVFANNNSRYGQVCPNNRDYRQFIEAELTELLSRYTFDGFFFDMTFWRGVCTCPSCRDRFRDETGSEIPPRIDWSDRAWCDFQTARERWMNEFAAFLTALAKRFGIAVVYHNFAVSLFNWRFGINSDSARHSDFLGGDFYGDMDEQFMTSRFMLNLSNTRPVEFMTSRCVHLTDHVSTKTMSQLRIQAFAALASSAAFRLIDAIDPEGTVCEEVYAMMGNVFTALEPYQPFLGGDPVEDVVIYLSDYSKMSTAENGADFADPSALTLPSPHLSAARGAVSALRRQRIPVGVITCRQLDRLGDYPVVVLPDATRMSAAEAAAFTAYVAGGGNLYVSGATGTYTLEGRSDDFLLGECLGLRYVRALSASSLYMKPVNDTWRRLCLPQPALCVHDGLHEVEARVPDLEILGTVTLPYGYPHAGSLEDQRWASIHSAPPEVETKMPAIARRRHGNGRVVYAAAALERSDHHVARRTFQWLISELLPDGPRFRAETHDHVWLTVFHQPAEGRFILHLLNYPADLPPVPIRNVRIEIRRTLGMTFRAMVPLPTGQPLGLDDAGANHVHVTLDELGEYAMLGLYYDPC
jgi:hypothetical protein